MAGPVALWGAVARVTGSGVGVLSAHHTVSGVSVFWGTKHGCAGVGGQPTPCPAWTKPFVRNVGSLVVTSPRTTLGVQRGRNEGFAPDKKKIKKIPFSAFKMVYSTGQERKGKERTPACFAVDYRTCPGKQNKPIRGVFFFFVVECTILVAGL